LVDWIADRRKEVIKEGLNGWIIRGGMRILSHDDDVLGVEVDHMSRY